MERKMKNILIVLTLAIFMMSCADSAEVEGKEYPFYGLANEETKKNDSLVYELSLRNTV